MNTRNGSDRFGDLKRWHIASPSDMLRQALAEDSNRELDWLWYAERVSGDAERAYCLERARYINPDNRDTIRQLAQLNVRRRAANAQSQHRPATQLGWMARMLNVILPHTG